MNVPCQVKQLTAGQIRLHIPSLTTQPEIIQPLMQSVMRLPDVTSIEIEPAAADLIIKHATTSAARDGILSALAGWPSLPERAPSAASPVYPYADCALIHATHGRVRLRASILGSQAELANVLSYHLSQQPGVRHVRLSPYAESIIIHHDPALLDAQSLVKLAASYEPDPQEIAQWRAATIDQRQAETRQPSRRKVDLALAAAALALSFFGGWLIYLLAVALLIASSWWIFRRAAWSIQERRFLTVESASTGAIVVLCLAGMLWQASLFVILLLVIALMRVRSAPAVVIQTVTPTAASPALPSQTGGADKEHVPVAGEN
jgi:hypothetical protein